MYDLGLRLPEVVAYAVIFGFSMDEESDFHGGRAYLCRKLSATKHTVDRALQTLEERGLIRKASRQIGGVTFSTYVAVLPEDIDAPAAGAQEPVAVPEAVSVPVAKKPKKFDFLASLLALGVPSDLADAWLQVRKAKKMVNTAIAFEAFEREVNLAGIPASECVKVCVEKSWGGFRAEWLQNALQSGSRGASGFYPGRGTETPRRGGIMGSEAIVEDAVREYMRQI